MTFRELLSRAKDGDRQTIETLLGLYKPLLLKESIVNEVFDENLYQKLCFTVLHCVKKFRL